MRSQQLQPITKPSRLPDYIVAALRNAGLSRRQYQETACLKAMDLLNRGCNVEIDLPPGTGKTLIGQIVACMWMRGRKSERVLCILPSSNLREQHYLYALRWAETAGLCRPLQITPEWVASKRFPHQLQLSKADLWFALPEIFANSVDRAYVSLETLAQVSLVLIDEYDSFSIGILRAEGEYLRFTKDFDRLLKILDWSTRRYVLMSATPAQVRSGEHID